MRRQKSHTSRLSLEVGCLPRLQETRTLILARMCRSKRQQSTSSARPQQGSGTQSHSRPTHAVDTDGSGEEPSKGEEDVYVIFNLPIFNLRQKKQPIRVEVKVNGKAEYGIGHRSSPDHHERNDILFTVASGRTNHSSIIHITQDIHWRANQSARPS